MGSSVDLKPNDSIYPVGHPLGLRPAYISPGNFQSTTTQKEILKSLDPDLDKTLATALKGVTPHEMPDTLASLDRSLLAGKVQIQPGDSGGPMFDAAGKVVGINDMITNFSQGYFVPVEKIRDLYNSNDSKFQFTYNRIAEPWAQDYKNSWTQKPIVAGAETLAAAGIGAAGLGLSKYYPRALAISGSAYEAYRLMDDADKLFSSTDSMDKLKFGISSAADLAGIVSGIAMLSSRYRVGGAAGLALGVGVRIAADFLPTHLVMTDIQRKDDPLKPPMNPDIKKILGF
jgi:hypothetical protein